MPVRNGMKDPAGPMIPADIMCKSQKVSDGSAPCQAAQTAEGPCAVPKEMMRARYLAADF